MNLKPARPLLIGLALVCALALSGSLLRDLQPLLARVLTLG